MAVFQDMFRCHARKYYMSHIRVEGGHTHVTVPYIYSISGLAANASIFVN